jgi:hypothetical protein
VLLEVGKPMHLHGCEPNGDAVVKAGPYLSSGSWWDEKHWSRQEWDAELDNGVLCRFHTTGETWELDGIYD